MRLLPAKNAGVCFSFEISITNRNIMMCLKKVCTAFRYRLQLTAAVLVMTTGLSGSIYAQGTGFVPDGVSLVSLEAAWSSHNAFLNSGSESTPALAVYRDRSDVDDDAVSGSVAHEKTAVILNAQYGLFNSFNLGVSVPYLMQKRNSDITLNDATQSAFAESIDNAESSGAGDIEIYGFWRVIYSDVADLQLGLALNGDNAPYNSDDHQSLALGSGSKELSLLLRYCLYSIHSPLKLAIELEYVFAEKGTVKLTDGRDVTKKQENSTFANFDLSSHQNALGYGGGLGVASVGLTKLDGVSMEDGYLAYSLRGFVTYGNLYLLENQFVQHPWEIRLLAEKNVAGNNAPDSQTLSLKLTTFF